MPSNILSELQEVYRNALRKTVNDPIRPLSKELETSFTAAIEELDALQQLADDNLRHITNLLTAIPKEGEIKKKLDAVPSKTPESDQAYTLLSAKEKELEERLAEPERYPGQRALLESFLEQYRIQKETLEKLDKQAADMKAALVYQEYLEKYIPLLAISVACLEKLRPLWSERVMNLLVLEQAKASVKETLKEIEEDFGQGDLFSRALSAVRHGLKLLLDATGALIICADYLHKLHTKGFTSTADLKALDALTPSVHEMLERHKNLNAILRVAVALLGELSSQEDTKSCT